MRHSFFVSLLLFLVAGTASHATEVTVRERAKYYRKDGKRLVTVGEFNVGAKLQFVKTLDKGKWVQATYGTQTVIVSSQKLVGVPGNRNLASTGSSAETVTGRGRSSFGVGPSVGYATALSALGVGLGAFYNPKDLLGSSVHQLSFGGYFHYYLISSVSATSSSSALSFAGVGRYQYRVTKEFDVGAELGASLVNASTSVTVAGFGTVSASASSFQALFGGFARYFASDSFQITVGLRLLGVPNFVGGFEYQF